MVIERISDALFPGDGDGNTHPPRLSPAEGAAGLLIEAARRDGRYTEIEADLVTASLMKLMHVPKPEAAAMRRAAEAAQEKSTTVMGFAAAAAGLPTDEREQLITAIWAITTSDDHRSQMERELLGTVSEVFEMPRARIDALRPAST